MSPVWWVVVGWLLAHLVWALVFVVAWYRLTRTSGQTTRAAIREDFAMLRDALRTKARR